jgi:hypothetical protein
MKEKLFQTMDEIIDLLEKCDWDDKANWFKSKQQVLQKLDFNSEEFRRELAELDDIIAGMGSFTDLPLYPKKGAKLTAQEAKNRQWDLAEKLGAAVDEILAKLPPARS